MVSRQASTGGAAKTGPWQAAVSMPGPTAMTWAGSWPEPEPCTIETLSAAGRSFRLISWNSGIASSSSGLAAITPAMNSGTKFSGLLTNFFMDCPLVLYSVSGVLAVEFGRLGRPFHTEIVAPVLQDGGDGDNARIGRIRAARADLAGAAAMGHEGAGGVDRLVRGVGGRGQSRLAVARCSMLLQRLMHRDQRVDQGLVAQLGAAAGHYAFDRIAEHVGKVGEADGGLAFRRHAGLHEARAPDRAGRSANMLRAKHGKLQQLGADIAFDLRQFGLDDLEARGQRSAEVAVAGEPVEVGKIHLVANGGV